MPTTFQLMQSPCPRQRNTVYRPRVLELGPHADGKSRETSFGIPLQSVMPSSRSS